MKSRTFYISSINGNDANDGLSANTPFLTLNKLNEIEICAGDKILLEKGSEFSGEYLHLDTALNIRILSSINNVIDRFKFEGFLAGGTCTRLLHNFGKMDFIHRVKRIHGSRSLIYEIIR